MHMIHGGRSRISKIRECTEAYRGRMQKESPQKLFESICEESSMAEYKKNPMFMRSVISDLSRLNQEKMCIRDRNLKPCVYKLWKHVKVRPRTFCRTVRRVAGTGKVKS